MNRINRSSILRALAAAVAAGAVAVLTGCVDPGDLTPLHDSWDRGDIVVTFSDDYGVFTEINSGAWRTILNNRNVKIGDKKFKNIIETGNYTWTAQELCQDGSGKSGYYSSRITMSADGQTIGTVVNEGSCTGNSAYTRITRPLEKRTAPQPVEDDNLPAEGAIRN
jgi:hypothetical protein